LPLARRLVQLHGGTLEASSPGEGRGSVFTVRLPLAAPAQPARAMTVDEGHS
jgi:signal transduction histidine kinase